MPLPTWPATLPAFLAAAGQGPASAGALDAHDDNPPPPERRDGTESTAGRLSTRLALSLGTMILAVGLVAGVLLALEDRRDRFDRAEARQQQAAAEFAARLSADMGERVQDVLLLARLDSFVAADATQRSRVLAQLDATEESYAWIGVTDAAGTVQAASPAGLLEGMDVSGRPWWQQGRNELFVGDVHDALLLADALTADGQQPPRFVDIAVPLVEGDQQAGVLGVHLFWSWSEQVREQVTSALAAGDTDVMILAADGQVLLPPTGTSATATPAPVGPLQGPSGRGVLAWTDGEYVTGWATAGAEGAFDGLGWTVVARRPAEPLTFASFLLGSQIVAAALVAALLVALAAWWRIRRATDQIRAITLAAQQLRNGHHAEIPQLGATHEVAVLSAALRELTDHLAARNRQLEHRTEQLAEASRARDQFTMMASHETRTPITVIRGAVKTLQTHQDSIRPEMRTQLLDAISRNALRLERLTAHMLAATEIEAGLRPDTATTEPVRPAEQLGAMAGPDVEIDGPRDLMVETDPSLVELTVGNLLDNATKYGRPPIHITYRHADGRLRISVRDHGPGIATDFTHRLFDRYAQASQGLRRTAVGAGLGLWLSRELLRRTGGDLTHQPVEGPGACFTATIPATNPT